MELTQTRACTAPTLFLTVDGELEDARVGVTSLTKSDLRRKRDISRTAECARS